MSATPSRTVRTTCRICYNNCGLLVRVHDGRAVSVAGDPDDPISRGRLCPKGMAALEILNHPRRLRHPLKRVAARGADQWQRIDWDEALDLTARGLQQTIRRHGPLSLAVIRGGSKGMSDAYLSRFANIVGTPNISSPAPVCFVPGVKASELTYGFYAYPDFKAHPACILIWGSNPKATTLPVYHDILAAKARGARTVVIDPLPSELGDQADIRLRVRPGTDLALALGLLAVVVEEQLYDRDFVSRWTVGFSRLESHLRDYCAERVAEITWVPAETIRAAAREYAGRRPGVICWGNGIETDRNSFQTCRALALLRAISGNLGVPGGDVKCSFPGGLRPNYPELSCRGNIPAAVRDRRLSKVDGLLPTVFYALPQTIVRAILTEQPYPVKAAYVQAANPLTAYPAAGRTFDALSRLDFLAVAELFMTPTAMLADVVLPAATFLEYDSIEQPWHLPVASVQQKVAQVGECRPDGKILNGLLKAMGYDTYHWKHMELALAQVLETAGITFDEFRRIGVLQGQPCYRHFQAENFATPSGKVELYSSQLAQWGFDPLPVFYPPPAAAEISTEFAYVLTTRKSEVFRHSGGRQIDSLRRQHPQPTATIHPDTAHALGCEPGDRLRITTADGSITQQVQVDPRLDPRVVEVDYAWWFPERPATALFDWQRSNVNVLTSDRLPFNREMGSATLRGLACRLEKERCP